MLAKATPQNKNYLEQYVAHVRPHGMSNYAKAFKAAFELIINTGDDQFNSSLRGWYYWFQLLQHKKSLLHYCTLVYLFL